MFRDRNIAGTQQPASAERMDAEGLAQASSRNDDATDEETTMAKQAVPGRGMRKTGMWFTWIGAGITVLSLIVGVGLLVFGGFQARDVGTTQAEAVSLALPQDLDMEAGEQMDIWFPKHDPGTTSCSVSGPAPVTLETTGSPTTEINGTLMRSHYRAEAPVAGTYTFDCGGWPGAVAAPPLDVGGVLSLIGGFLGGGFVLIGGVSIGIIALAVGIGLWIGGRTTMRRYETGSTPGRGAPQVGPGGGYPGGPNGGEGGYPGSAPGDAPRR